MKQRLTFEETAVFLHDVEVEIENEEAEANLEAELREDYNCLEDILHAIGGIPGVKITNAAQDESGQSSDIELYDSRDLKEE